MSEEEYLNYIKELLLSLGGSYATPSGQASDGLYFSCLVKPIMVPHPDMLTPEQRVAVTNRLAEKFGFPVVLSDIKT